MPPPPAAEKALEQLAATPDNVRLDNATADPFRGELDAHRDAVRIARTLAAYNRGRHEFKLGPTLIDTLLTETQEARAVGRLLTADAAVRAQDGDIDGALDSCLADLGVARSIGDEPFLISQLVRISIGTGALRAVRRTLGQGEPSDEALARVQALIIDEFGQPLLLYGVKSERAELYELIRRLGAGEIPISALSQEGRPFRPASGRTTVSPWGRLWYDMQRAAALEWMNEAVAIAGQPSATRPALWKAWDANRDRVMNSRLGPYNGAVPLLLMPPISKASSGCSRYQSELGATAILLAAERHRRRAGDWPASIESIDPAILPRPPVDPFSGRPFRLERGDGQFVIYSIGPDHIDDHGAYEPRQWDLGGPDDVGAGAWDVPLRAQAPSAEASPTTVESNAASR
jgi:hypothetical protein